MSVGRVMAWQQAWANSELGYEPSDDEIALLLDAQRRPDYYWEASRPTKSRKAKPKAKGNARTYRLPYTII